MENFIFCAVCILELIHENVINKNLEYEKYSNMENIKQENNFP